MPTKVTGGLETLQKDYNRYLESDNILTMVAWLSYAIRKPNAARGTTLVLLPALVEAEGSRASKRG